MLPPGPRTPSALNAARFARRPLDTLLAWRDRYGDVFTVTYAGFGQGVYVAEPDALRGLLTGDQSDLRAGEPNEILSPVVGHRSVLVLDGPEHLRQRRLLLPPFHGERVSGFRATIREVAEREVGGWAAGDRFAVRDRMAALTFDVICRVVFGVHEPARVERLRAALGAVMDTRVLVLLPGPLQRDLGRWSPGGRLARRLAVADALLHEEIARRRGVGDLDERTDVLSLLLRARDEEGRPLTDVELRDELVTMLVAGHETTATTLAFAVDLLLRTPGEMDRLRDAVAAGDDAHVEAVATETLRLRPVIDAAQRHLTAPRTVAGWDLPAGTVVYPAIALTHLRADLYPQPHTFRPDRFRDGTAPAPYTWLPFGGGIRRCLGAPLAQAELVEVLKVLTAGPALRPEREAPDPVVLRGVTMAPKHGVPVVVG